MSIKVTSMIWERLDSSGGELNLALAIGDFSNDDGESIYPSVGRLASKSRQDRRTVQRQLARFREVGWLEVVVEGGMAGGRGNPTKYRISPVWIKGGNLPLFPDRKPDPDEEIKGGNLPPFDDERAASTTLKGGIHDTKGRQSLPPNPSLTVRNLRGEDARANPSGSRASPGKEPEPYDARARHQFWISRAINAALSDARLFEIVPRGSAQLADLPETPQRRCRSAITARCRSLADWAVTEEQKSPARPFRELEQVVTDSIQLELRAFRPNAQAQIAASFEEPRFADGEN